MFDKCIKNLCNVNEGKINIVAYFATSIEDCLLKIIN